MFAVVSAEKDRVEGISFRGKGAHDSYLNDCSGRASTLKENGLDQGPSRLRTAEMLEIEERSTKIGSNVLNVETFQETGVH